MAEDAASVYPGLRSLALNTTAATLGFPALTAGTAYAVVMDIGMTKGVATIVSFLNGDASIYLSTGGGMIGGGPKLTVNRAAKNFVATASSLASQMQHASDAPLPDTGHVFFYVLTPDGMLSANASEKDLQSGHSPLSTLYASGQMVITAYRQLPSK